MLLAKIKAKLKEDYKQLKEGLKEIVQIYSMEAAAVLLVFFYGFSVFMCCAGKQVDEGRYTWGEVGNATLLFFAGAVSFVIVTVLLIEIIDFLIEYDSIEPDSNNAVAGNGKG
jgi:predicted branched-subunit amino acid permease